jgi:hypothetical protein
LISSLESEDSSADSLKENLDQPMNNETKQMSKPRRSAAEHANQALQTLIQEGAFGGLDQVDEEYKGKIQEDLGRNGEGSREIIENGSGNTSQETTQSDSAKEILVCKYQ